MESLLYTFRIRKLREKGIDSDEILEIIEYIEMHEPREDNSEL